MSFAKDEIAAEYRAAQAAMKETYSTRAVSGKKVEIPWKAHEPVQTIFYYPTDFSADKLPVYINLHGGGFVEGDMVTMDSFCRKLADEAGILVVNMNYHLAPDYVFPYPLQETQTVCDYLRSNSSQLQVNVQRIGLGGFSAGATIALGLLIQSIQSDRQMYHYCVCGYPAVSFFPTDCKGEDGGSAIDEKMGIGIQIYENGNEMNPVCTPLLADDETLGKMPKTCMFVAGVDELNRQGRRFAARLAANGVTICFHEYKDAYHGFFEVNREDYFLPDSRKNNLQKKLTEEAEQFVIQTIKGFVFA